MHAYARTQPYTCCLLTSLLSHCFICTQAVVHAFGIIGIDHTTRCSQQSLVNELQTCVTLQDRRPLRRLPHGGNGRLRGCDPALDLSAAHGAQVLLWSQSVGHDCPTTSTTSWRYIFYLDGYDACEARDGRRGTRRRQVFPLHAACVHATGTTA